MEMHISSLIWWMHDKLRDITLSGRCNNKKVVAAVASQRAGTSGCIAGWSRIRSYAGELRIGWMDGWKTPFLSLLGFGITMCELLIMCVLYIIKWVISL